MLTTEVVSFEEILNHEFFNKEDIEIFTFFNRLEFQIPSNDEKFEKFKCLFQKLQKDRTCYSKNVIMKKIIPGLVMELALKADECRSQPKEECIKSTITTMRFLFLLFQRGIITLELLQEKVKYGSDDRSTSPDKKNSPAPNIVNYITSFFSSIFSFNATTVSSNTPNPSRTNAYILSVLCNAIFKLFSSSEKQIRIVLLENLAYYHKLFDNDIFRKTIFPAIRIGFNDPNPAIRDYTMRLVEKENKKRNYIMRLLKKSKKEKKIN